MTTFAEKIVLITGATSGIGEAAAHAFAGEGATVIVNGRWADKGAAFVAATEAAGGSAEFSQGGVSDKDTTRGIVETIVAWRSRMDTAFNTAGVKGKKRRGSSLSDRGCVRREHRHECRRRFLRDEA